MNRPDELDKLTDAARIFCVQNLDIPDITLAGIDGLIYDNETHAALLALCTESCEQGILWPSHLVDQFRYLRKKFWLEQEFEEFMEWQNEIRAKAEADASKPDA